MDQKERGQRMIAQITSAYNDLKADTGHTHLDHAFDGDLVTYSLAVNQPVRTVEDVEALIGSVADDVARQVHDQALDLLSTAIGLAAHLGVISEQMYPDVDFQRVIQELAVRVATDEDPETK